MKTFVKRLVPAPMRPAARRQYERARGALNALLGRNDPLMPPEHLIFVGGDSTNFKQLGEKWLRTFVEVGGLRPKDRVLDVGSGVGRMAGPLSGYLKPGGTYDGFDIVREGVEWCQKNITPRSPHFRFQHADIFNKEYNPGGRVEGSRYRFPFEDGTFDFVFLTSVFTHMLPADVQNYLSEIGRVMRPGGRCLITFFILNEYSLARVEAGEVPPGRNFRYDAGGCRTTTPETPEAAIAYDEADVREMFVRAGLKIEEPIHYGGWSGREGARHGQDIVVATRP